MGVTAAAVIYAVYKHITMAQLRSNIATEIAKFRANLLAAPLAVDYEKVITAIRAKL